MSNVLANAIGIELIDAGKSIFEIEGNNGLSIEERFYNSQYIDLVKERTGRFNKDTYRYY